MRPVTIPVNVEVEGETDYKGKERNEKVLSSMPQNKKQLLKNRPWHFHLYLVYVLVNRIVP